MKFKTLDLLRHGEPVGGNVLRGRTDHELTDLGWQQLKEATQGKEWDVIITSPLSRCHEFSKQLASELNIPVVVSEDLREFDFGIWENQKMEVVFKDDFERIKGMWDDPMNFVAPEGESILDFEARILKAWFGCLSRSEERQLIVCHGGVIRMLLKEVLGLPFKNINRLDVPFASRSQVKVNEKEPFHYQLMTHG
jgi:alpha-ribazole phosphatase